MSALLSVSNIDTFIGQSHILEGVSFDVPRGSITALLGRNGAGKTTTLRSIIGLLTPRNGQITYDGNIVSGKPPYHIAARGIGYVPEHRAIFKALTVEKNLIIAERKKGDLKRREDLIFTLFPDLKTFYSRSGGNLSGGQQQMLAIARALVPQNNLLLIDEPSEGLAPIIVEAIGNALRKLRDSMTVLLVEQNFRFASMLADRYVILDDGKVASTGVMSDLQKDAATVQRFLGVVA